MDRFAHLHLHTHYSLLDGLTRPSSLVQKIKENNMTAVAITDHGNMYGAIEFYKECVSNGINPIMGVEVYICGDMHKRSLVNNETHHLTLLAENNEGYENLIKLVSEANLKGYYYKPRIDLELLKEYKKGLFCLSGCLGGELSQAILNREPDKAEAIAREYREIFGDRYYIEIQRHPENKEQSFVTPNLIELSKTLEIPLVATGDSHYLNHEDKDTHEILLAVQTHKKMDDVKRFSLAENDLHVATQEEMLELFKDIPEAVYNSGKIADMCKVEIELHNVKLPPYKRKFTDDYDSELAYMCVEALTRMFPNNEEYKKRMDFELGVIRKTNFASYLLIIQDIVNHGKGNGIVFGPGRGSAAGCLLSYLLNITTIDPIKYGLFFERFMNPDRISPPDIDIDIEDKRRGEVIQYIVDTYGQDNVAQIITFGTMFARSSIRDVGRVLGTPLEISDSMAKEIPFGKTINESLKLSSELKKLYGGNKQLLDTAMKLEGTIRHSGVHACGIVISDKNITEYMPVQLSKDNHITSQFDMKAIDDMGLLKMDMLGLRNLSVISECQKLIKEQVGFTLDIDNIPLNDERAFKLLQEGKTTSVFQLESLGMKKYLRQLKPTDIHDVAAMISLYRPGPMELIGSYIKRKYGEERVEYLDPKLKPVLSSTYGIMIYQEQMMQAVQVLAGFTLAEADLLRKAVGKKIKQLLLSQESKFKKGCEKVGTSKNVANQFWSLIEPFSRYGFNLSHAVSYAMISYQTAYLKANYPTQFMMAEINSDGKIERIKELLVEFKDMGIKVMPPSVNFSSNAFSSRGNVVNFPISGIKGLGEKVSDIIVSNRNGSKYLSIQDFSLKNSDKIVNKKTVELLGKSGALDDLIGESLDRNNIVSGADIIASFSKFEYKELLPLMVLPVVEKATQRERNKWEKEMIGFQLSK